MTVDGEVGNTTLPPLLGIWFRPRRTIRAIVDSDPGRFVILLAALSGLGRLFSQVLNGGSGRLILRLGWLVALIAAPVIGVVSLYLVGALLWWIGGWFGGRADYDEVRAAMAWSTIPELFGSLLIVPALLLLGLAPQIAQSAPALGTAASILLTIVGIAMSVAGLWTIAVLILCLAEVHRFSIWRSLATTLAGGVIVFIPVFIVLVLAQGLYIGP